MFLDPLSIITNGLAYANSINLTNDYLSVSSIGVIDNINKSRIKNGSSDGVYDGEYKTIFEYLDTETVPIPTITEIAEYIKQINGDEILVTLKYKPRNSKGAEIKCSLLEKKVSVELVELTNKKVKVSVLYITNN